MLNYTPDFRSPIVVILLIKFADISLPLKLEEL